jgi:glutaredoxin
MRRVKVFTVLIFIFVITLLFYTASVRQSRPQDSRTVGDFYERTVNALNSKNQIQTNEKLTEDEIIAKKMAESLKEAEQAAKDSANAKAQKPDPPSQLVGVGSAAEGARGDEISVAGRKKYGGSGAGNEQKVVSEEGEEEQEESKEDHQVEVELNSILKKSPSEFFDFPHQRDEAEANSGTTVIIFSKSYCPHSKRAKGILLEKYAIDPPPYVVELDQHPLGAGIQAHLAKSTGRRTVPNVLINAVSIGGGDDVADLDAKNELIDKIKELGGKKMLNVELRPIGEESHGLK